jgi:hypothetical protein
MFHLYDFALSDADPKPAPMQLRGIARSHAMPGALKRQRGGRDQRASRKVGGGDA